MQSSGRNEVDDELDGFLHKTTIARLEDVNPRTITNRVASGTFPKPDAVIDGLPVWRRSTYAPYQADVLAGRYVGRDRMAHLRQRPEPEAA